MRRSILCFLLSLSWLSARPLATAGVDAAAEAAENIGRRGAPGAAPNDPRLNWFREAKYGLFIHWGLYSVPGGVWKGKSVGFGEWLMNKMQIPIPEYAQLAGQFNPTNFNADEWAQLAQDAGMKYLVITSKHHDGFAMFHSQATAYNVMDATPWKRDPLKELQGACARHGVKLCFYYSHAADWHEPDAGGFNTWDFPTNAVKNFDVYFDGKVIPQVTELLKNYGSIGLLWFDWPGQYMTPERCKKLADTIHALQPDTLINSRLGPKPAFFKEFKGCYWDYQARGDNEVPPEVTPGVWETAATINTSWGYRIVDEEKAKSPAAIAFQLVDVVSKGGNYLLNVGPDGTGRIPQVSQDSLRRVGAWLKVNGEAIYGAGPTPFGPELGAYVPDGKPDKNGKKPFAQKKEWRCTTRPGKFYVHLFQWPAGDFTLGAVKVQVRHAYLMSDRQTPLKVSQADGVVRVSLPAQKPDPIASVLVLEYDSAL